MQIWSANKEGANGLFYNWSLNVDQPGKTIWFLIVKVKGEFALSRHTRGWKLLGVNDEKQKHLYAQYPAFLKKDKQKRETEEKHSSSC